METKYVRVPFEVELAKKITNGEVEGRIVTRSGNNVRILCFDRKGTQFPIIALVEINVGEEDYFSFYINGDYDITENSANDLFLEISEQMTFKDGDVVAFGSNSIGIFKKIDSSRNTFSSYATLCGNTLIYYEPAWRLVNAHIATEEEKQKLIDALKQSEDTRAKECLKKLGIEVKQEFEFKPFDKVLVRDSKLNEWKIDIFREFIEDGGSEGYRYNCFYDNWNYCIPYNEQTAHLLGTTENYE